MNPVAGLGGRVALKGTDGLVDEARRRGATPLAPDRALAFVQSLRSEHEWITAAGEMGEDALARAGESALVVYAAGDPTTAEDTTEAARAIVSAGAALLVFVGGDGTAADVLRGVEGRLPILGVPAGVKMYSAVFAETPEAAARVVESAWDATEAREILDIDEEAFRKDDLRVALRGIAQVPSHRQVAGGKLAEGDDEVEQESLADAVLELVKSDETLILGAGTTLLALKRRLGIDGTLLGVDVARVLPGPRATLVKRDARERDLLEVASGARIVVSPIGQQGFILGRGNAQISPEVVRRAGVDAVTVVASPTKLHATPLLRVDTGDPALDRGFPDWVRVVTGHGQTKLCRLSKG